MRRARCRRRRRWSRASSSATTATTRRWSRSIPVASVSPAGDACEIWCGTQSQTMAVAAVAKALGIPVEKVKLNLTLLGGGFGRRGHRDEEFVVDSVLLSKEVKRPVKVLWTREDDVHNGRFRPLSVHFLRAGTGFVEPHRRLAAPRRLRRGHRVPGPGAPTRAAGRRISSRWRARSCRTYDIPNRLSEQLPQVTGIRTSPCGASASGRTVRDRGVSRRDRGEAGPRSG